MSVLVTGGTGFIGSHTVVKLLNAGITPIIADNLSNSKKTVLDRIKTITGHSPKFYEMDLCDANAVKKLFDENTDIDSVIHFAGLKAVGESVTIPLRYYENNILSTLVLCREMEAHGVHRMVFSSSATVYGVPKSVPMREDAPTSATNPYGQSKLMIEQILTDWCVSNSDLSVCCLRYFNPIGAHSSGLIGEDPNGIPNNLVPYVAKVACGKLPHVNIFGDDYDTHDGTGVRDYIHVVDLANAHLCALKYTEQLHGADYINVGTGKGYSVLDVIHAYEAACGHNIPYKIAPRRSGDIATSFADPSKAARLLGWTAEYDLDTMCRDSVKWSTMNPAGYPDC